MREITRPANALVKVFRRSLQDGLTREGWLAIEGPLLVREAIRAAVQGPEKRRIGSRCTVHTVLVSAGAVDRFGGLLASLPREAEVIQAPADVFERITATMTPQGIAALAEVQQPALEAVLRLKDPILMVAYGLQDPGNLGTILRSAEALGADALITLRPAVSPYNPKILRACGGAVFRLPVFPSLEAKDFFSLLRQAGISLVAADRHSAQGVAEADLRGPLAFLIGNEAAGLPKELTPDLSLGIPLFPGVDSLNASVAGGILLYEAARQRGFRY